MYLLSKLGRRVASLAAVGVVTAAVVTALASSAAAADVYYRIQNTKTLYCLTAGTGQTVHMAPCTTTSAHQQWLDVSISSSSMKLVKNKATGRCLTTNNTTSVAQDVWTSKCDEKVWGQHWSFNDIFFGSFYYPGLLRTSPANVTAVLSWDGYNLDGDSNEELRSYSWWDRLAA